MSMSDKLAAARAYLAQRNLQPRVPVATRWIGLERTYASRREAEQALNLRRMMEGKS